MAKKGNATKSKTALEFKSSPPKPASLKPPAPPAKTRAQRVDAAVKDMQRASYRLEPIVSKSSDKAENDALAAIDAAIDDLRSATDGWQEDLERLEDDLREAEGKVEDAEGAATKAIAALKVVQDWFEARLHDRLFRCAECDQDALAQCATCRSYKELLAEIVGVL